MDPASVSTTARVASSVARPIIARLFAREGQGAGLVDKPVRLSGWVRWGGEKQGLGRLDMWKIARELVKAATEANPYEPPVGSEEREALADALAETLAALGDLDMDDVQAVRLGHRELARSLAAARPDATRDLSGDATALYDSLLELSCLHILHFFTQRSTFVAHAQVAQTRLLDETLRLLDALVDRIPRPGSADEAFEARYLAHIERKYGKLNIFGLDLSGPGQARWPLDAAYLNLELASHRDGGSPSANRRRVEEALSGCNRAVLRGLAGSGKTTLMQWLAVCAAQDSFGDELAGLRGRVPFMLPLRAMAKEPGLPDPERFLGAVGNMLHGLQPDSWADRVLSSGRGMLLIDGVDEVSESERPVVRRWLLDLVDLYPEAFFLVTTRPSAVETHWLAEVDFAEFNLLPMNRHDVDRFVHRWHDAVLTAVDDPEERVAVERCRDALRTTLRQKHDLYRLATNPLMCALICALHRDRLTHLPERRMELYAAALSMLLVRRDKEREIPVPEGLVPTEEAQVQLLQRIAYWLIRNGRSEAAQTTAVRIIREKLPAMPALASPDRAEDVFRYLLLRSGLLREPSVGMVDFIHRTFQDYLGAKAAVEAEDLGLLAESGRDDQWDDVIRLAIGHARDGERAYLLRRLIELGDQASDPQLRRRYHLLAAAALEHATTLDPAVRAAVSLRASALIPPDTPADAEQLATAGDIVLDLLPGPTDLNAEQARATVMTIARIGGEVALHQLAAFQRVPVREVRQEVALSWPYFDAQSFAEEVLSGLPADDIVLFLSSPEQAAGVHLLNRAPHLSLRGQLLTSDLVAVLAGLEVSSLVVEASSAVSIGLPSLAPLGSLRRLVVESCDVVTNLEILAECRAEELVLHRLPRPAGLAFLERAPNLRSLTLSSEYGVPLPAVPLPRVGALEADGVLTGEPLPDLAAAFPGLSSLKLRLTCQSYQSAVDLSPLAAVRRGQIEVTLVGAGKVHGLDCLPADRVTVRHEGRTGPHGRTRLGLLRRRRP
ncbi:NACHT domain-containing protein [Streptomyces cyanogenus]|uniref:NACHT domain protein n=1 Tax=Streptomyces cyanogenus TaxID=80860 RepID=A0ABX7U0D1_STRCY|nr:NACHT domain-containing protein [Streptomyces cyanogenus]QTE02473.1 NACHT domain protein [Streptomyces cyanogenus]